MGERDKIFDVEDEIIFTFCQDYGGLEEGMPIIREQFKRAGMDFREPTKKGLQIVVENLVKVTASLRGPEVAKEQRARFQKLLRSLDE